MMNLSTQLTNWYPANIKPVRNGWYETLHPKYGQSFVEWRPSPLGGWCRGQIICNGEFQSKAKWRGLTNERSTR
jgi:hypothetical protein